MTLHHLWMLSDALRAKRSSARYAQEHAHEQPNRLFVHTAARSVEIICDARLELAHRYITRLRTNAQPEGD